MWHSWLGPLHLTIRDSGSLDEISAAKYPPNVSQERSGLDNLEGRSDRIPESAKQDLASWIDVVSRKSTLIPAHAGPFFFTLTAASALHSRVPPEFGRHITQTSHYARDRETAIHACAIQLVLPFSASTRVRNTPISDVAALQKLITVPHCVLLLHIPLSHPCA
jgi:hypothetical protein